MSLFFVNCEGTVLFSVKCDLDTPSPPLPLPPSVVRTGFAFISETVYLSLFAHLLLFTDC